MACAIGVNAGTDESVGVIDYQKLGQSISFQDLFKTKMEAAIGNSRQELETLSKAVQEKANQLNGKNVKLTAEQKKSLTEAVDELKKKLSDKQSEAQKKAMEVRTNMGNELKKKLEDVVGQVAAKHNVTVVFNNSSLAYAANKVDLTDEVIAELAKSLGVKVNAPNGQQPAMGMPMNRPIPTSKPADTQ
jgi:Skp family chaperone for outer membrane proteins